MCKTSCATSFTHCFKFCVYSTYCSRIFRGTAILLPTNGWSHNNIMNALLVSRYDDSPKKNLVLETTLLWFKFNNPKPQLYFSNNNPVGMNINGGFGFVPITSKGWVCDVQAVPHEIVYNSHIKTSEKAYDDRRVFLHKGIGTHDRFCSSKELYPKRCEGPSARLIMAMYALS